MAKMRIYELAKELNVENAELLGFLGLDGKTASSSLEDEEVARARQHFAPKKESAPAKAEASQSSRFAGQSIFKSPAKAPEEKAAAASALTEGAGAQNAAAKKAAAGAKPASQGAASQKTGGAKKPMFKMIGPNKAGSAPSAVSSSAYTDKNAKRPVRPERPVSAGSSEPHRPIKPNVQTTAEQYQRFAGSEIRKFDAEKAAKEEAERLQAERAAKEAALRAEREAQLQAQKEAEERAAREAAERAAAEKAAAEKALAEKAAKEAAERAAAEKAAAERAAKEAAEAAERAAKERAEAIRAAEEAAQAEREALERAAREAEEAAKKAAAEKAALEKAAAEKAAAEKAAKAAAERAAKEKAAAERAAQEKADKERARAAQNQNRQGQQNNQGKNLQNKDNRKGGKFVRPDGQNAGKPQNEGQKKTSDGGFWKTPSGEKTPGPVKRTLHTLDSLEPVKKVAVLGKVDLNAVKKLEEKPQSNAKKGIFANRSGRVYFVDNNQGGQGAGKPQGQRPGQRDGGFRQGGGAGTFNKDGDSPAPGRRPQGAGQRRPGQGAQAGAAQGAAFGKPDQRGRKGTPNKRDSRDNFDRGGKRAENFHNLAKDQNKKNTREVEVEEQIKQITLPDSITVRELADKMKIKATEIVKKLFLAGKMISVNDEISYEEAENIAIEYDILCEHEEQVDVIGELLKEADEDEKNLEKRPPVVCVMGHVDHGKTSLLDAIRHTNVISREAGGITQHIGAYMVEINGEKITFLDTPGHEAFTAMRMRGAQATDIAILVVAADDGVMPQTVEAINHAKAANVDIIVAVNKIDKPAANVDRVKQELSEYGLIPEDWGGSTVFVPVSAKKNVNIDQLLEMILLVTEVKELKANPNREMRGLVIEAKLDKGRGPVATVLVQKGTLKQGDFISAGSYYGRVRAMLDADGNEVKKATPSTPVEVLGLNGVPMAGEVTVGHKNEKEARSFAETFIAEERKKMLAETKHKLTMDSLFEQIREGELKELPLVVKADVQGSVEAICSSLEKLSNDEVTVRVIHAGVGAITESDVTLAAASNAIVIGFNTKPDQQGRMIAEQEKVDVRLYKVIYQAIDDVQAALQGMLAPVYEEKVLGHAEVRMIFKASGIGSIAGSYVLDGTIERGAKARVTRGKDQIYEGAIASLKRFKDDAKEVREGFECGIVFEKFNDLQEGDIVEAYKMVRVEQK